MNRGTFDDDLDLSLLMKGLGGKEGGGNALFDFGDESEEVEG